MKRQGFRNILFDLDGTLTDPAEGITGCIRYAMERLGVQAPPASGLLWCIGPPLRESFSKLLGSSDKALLEAAVGLYRQRFSSEGIYENRLYPMIRPALRALAGSGLLLMLATSKPTVFAETVLAHFRLSDFFDSVYGSGLDGSLANKGELIRHVLAEGRLDLKTTLMVGDRKHDVEGARLCGIRSGAVTWGYGSLAELGEAKPDYIFNTPKELVTFLLNS